MHDPMASQSSRALNEKSFTTIASASSARSRVIMRAAFRTLAFLVGLVLAGCMTPPKVSPVEKPVDTRTDLGLSPVSAPTQDAWWAAYQDPQLDRLLAAALADNPTLGHALARLHQAQAVVDATRAELSPSISYGWIHIG
jgi:hypothetical protein